MGKWVLYTQPNYVHPKPIQTHSFDTPYMQRIFYKIYRASLVINDAYG